MNRNVKSSAVKFKIILLCFSAILFSSTPISSIQGNPLRQKNSFIIDTTKIYRKTSNWQRSSRVSFDGTNFLVVWEDIRKDECSQIRGCRVSQDGQILDKGGFTISLIEPYTFRPALAYDGINYLVVWQSQTPYTCMAINAARVTPSGEILDTSAILISDTYSTRKSKPVVASSGTNYLVVWSDVPSGYPGIYGARVSPDGTLLDTIPICTPTEFSKPEHPVVAFDGTNYMVMWKDIEEFGWNCNIYIRGVRISKEGTILDSIPFFFVTIDSLPGGIGLYMRFCRLNPFLHFGIKNYLLSWNYRISGDLSKDIFGCRITPDGIVLDTNYICISETQGDQIFPSIAFDGSEFLVAWEDFRNDSFGFKPAIYFTKIDTLGNVLDTLGRPLLKDTTTKFQNPSVCFGGSEYLISLDDRRGIPFKYAIDDEISFSRVNIEGNPIDSSGILVTISTQHQRMPAVGFDGVNHLVIWEDERAKDIDLYGAIVDTAGNILTPPGIFVVSDADNDQINPSVDFINPYYLIAWEDYRWGDLIPQLYGTRITKGGSVLNPEGIQLYYSEYNQFSPQVSNDSNNFLVVWRENIYWSDYSIVAVRIDTSGTVIDSNEIVIDSTGHGIKLPAVSFDGDNYLITYKKSNYIIGVRLSKDGIIIFPYFNISDGFSGYDTPSISFNGATYFVVWTERDGSYPSNEDIYGSRVSPEGYDMDSVDILISNKSNNQYTPKTVGYGENFLVVWVDTRNDTFFEDCNRSIFGTYVSSNGIVLDTNGILLTPRLSDSKSPSIANSAGDRFLLCYSDFTESPYGSYRIYGIFIDTLTGMKESKEANRFVNRLVQNFPNPFTKSTVIHYQVREKGFVELSIFNVSGQLIKTIVDERVNPGIYTLRWNGKDTNGNIVSNGVYFYKLKTKNFSITKKMVLVK
ncbi:MAG: T9SS type A sorting domain-containing protein [Candidatus Cloacimonadota bacterium]|nr:MAG: T9SS type A sorting domain-containing protein [Candidatus Cloacimonadota bacterium]